MISKLQCANLAAFILNTFVTYAGGMANLFGGKTNSQISKEYTSLVTPSGYAFSIWGIIFIGEGLFTIWQTLPAQKDSPIIAALGYWWVAANLFQSLWTFAFAYEVMWLAFFLLVSIAVSLVFAYTALHAGSHEKPYMPLLSNCRPAASSGVSPVAGSLGHYWLCLFPLSVHCGWVIAASFVNLNLASIHSGASHNTQVGLAIASIAGLASINACVAWPRKDPVVGGVAAWAFIAIASKLRASTGTMRQGESNGAPHYITFDTDLLGELATALYVVACIHATASVALIVYKAWITCMPRREEVAEEEEATLQVLESHHPKDEGAVVV